MAIRFARSIILTTAAALALAGCGSGGGGADGAAEQPVAEKVAAPAGKSWSEVAARSPDGGLVVGNPAAAIKVIEFASLTCGACAQFSADSGDELKKDFIDTGRVSFEVRHFLRNPIDLLAASIVQCAPADRQHALTSNIMASQQDLFAGAETGGEAAQAAMNNQTDPARFAKAADALGISTMFQSRGMAADQVKACLSNTAEVEKLVADNNKWIEQYEVSGTPTFVVNGEVVGTLNWAGLRDRLRTMGAR
jgi:protein-disulfide isomerase